MTQNADFHDREGAPVNNEKHALEHQLHAVKEKCHLDQPYDQKRAKILILATELEVDAKLRVGSMSGRSVTQTVTNSLL